MRHCQWMLRLEERLAPQKRFADEQLVPLMLLLMRFAVAKVFLTSGWLKLGYVLHDQTETLYSLFEEYKVPLLPVKAAAWMGMCGELGFSTLLLLGYFGRLGALGLIFMSAVIYHTDGNPLALYWALICALIALMGPGKWSLDALLWSKPSTGHTIH